MIKIKNGGQLKKKVKRMDTKIFNLIKKKRKKNIIVFVWKEQ